MFLCITVLANGAGGAYRHTLSTVFAPFLISVFCIFITQRFQFIKPNLVTHRDNPKKYKMQSFFRF